MQFVVIAYDGKDPGALDRRLGVREEHIRGGHRLRDAGTLLHAVAILDEADTMIGTVAVYDVGSREELDRLLEIEPYVKGDVWRDITILPCRVGPSFRK